MRSKSWKRSNELITPRRIERPGVVDEVVDSAPCSFEHARDQRVARRACRRRRRSTSSTCRRRRRSPACVSTSFSSPRATRITFAPASASFSAVALPMPDDPPVTTTTLSLTRPDRLRSMNRSGIEVALPVVPQLRRVGLERRHLDAGALERLRGFAVVVARRPVDELEHVARDAEVGQHDADRALDRRERRRVRRGSAPG